LGGDLTVQSQLGKGSTFSVLLPVHWRWSIFSANGKRSRRNRSRGDRAGLRGMLNIFARF